jgi:hypothetical protein
VAALDASGGEGDPQLFTVTVTAPPRPPARGPSGARVSGSYDPGTGSVALSWLPSPDDPR